jgi:hypothetical protein
MMGTQGEQLADQFARVHGDVVAAVAELDGVDLARRCAAEQVTVAALAGHIAQVYGVNAGWVQLMVAGQPLPDITMADIDRINAEQAGLNAGLGKDELLARLQANGDRMIAVLRGLRDGDPERTAPFGLFGGAPVSVQTLVEQGLLAHVEEHLASLRTAVAVDDAPH